ncbi:type II toxin-antitoxin system prevent-host-death family antitoxin [Marinactinospora rubrisoli]|uniref:Type II toxin-antitoxin system prevent-host-death family antitoxin n=1 Tax=Marinactinospora rubrisoli TaxID=2715399 RepID=A0ABW2KQQ4_9ACTN
MTRSVPSEEARARLGDLVDEVQTRRVTVAITVQGVLDGALVGVEAARRAGLRPAGRVGIRQGRESWAALRRAAEQVGPQTITRHGRDAALLVSAAHARDVATGLPVVPARELSWDGAALTDEHARPIPPGRYLVPGGRLTAAPESSAPSDTTPAQGVTIDGEAS